MSIRVKKDLTDREKQIAAIVSPADKKIYTKKEIEDEEKKLDLLVENLEKGFIEFGKIVRIPVALIPDANTREQMDVPFALIEINKNNPHKNYREFARWVNASQATFKQDNINYFFYNFAVRQGFAASFAHALRIVELNPKINTNNILDMLILYHELLHVGQDTKIRAGLDTKEKFDSYVAFGMADKKTQAPRIILNQELSAYGYQLMLMDIILHGEIQTAIRQGIALDAEYIRQELRANSDQLETVKLLVLFAEKFWPQGLSLGGFTREFTKTVAEHVAGAGYEMYVILPEGLKRVSLEDL